MPELLARLQGARREKTAREQALADKLKQIKAEERFNQIREQIKILEEKRQGLDQLITELETGYQDFDQARTPLEKTRKRTRDIRSKLKQADEAIDKFFEEHESELADLDDQALEDAGLARDKQGLLAVPAEKQEGEVKSYHQAEAELGPALADTIEKSKSAREKVKQLKSVKHGKVSEYAEGEPGEGRVDGRPMHKLNKEELLSELRKRAAALEQKLNELKIQTPEGRKEAKELIGKELGHPSGREDLIIGGVYMSQTPEVRFTSEKFFGAAAKSGSAGDELVQEFLAEETDARLKEQLAEMEKQAGLTDRAEELAYIKALPKRYEDLATRLAETEARRGSIVDRFNAKVEAEPPLKARVKYYFDSSDLQRLAEVNPGQAWLRHQEKRRELNVLLNEDNSRRQDIESGPPSAALVVLRTGDAKTAIEELSRAVNSPDQPSRVTTEHLPNPDKLESNLNRYDVFLGCAETTIESETDKICPLGNNERDQFDDVPWAGATGSTFENIRRKHPSVLLDRSLSQLEEDLNQAAGPLRRAYEQRKACLLAQLHLQWSNQRQDQQKRQQAGTIYEAKKLERQKSQIAALESCVSNLREKLTADNSGGAEGASLNRDLLSQFSFKPAQIAQYDGPDKKTQFYLSHPLTGDNRRIAELLSARGTAKAQLENFKRDNPPPRSGLFSKKEKEIAEHNRLLKKKEQAAEQAEADYNAAADIDKQLKARSVEIAPELTQLTNVFTAGGFEIGERAYLAQEFLDELTRIGDQAKAQEFTPEQAKIMEENRALEQQVEKARLEMGATQSFYQGSVADAVHSYYQAKRTQRY